MRDPFLDFWEESSLTKYNIREYGSKMSGFDADNKELKLSYPKYPVVFKNKKSKLSLLTKLRKSVRNFGNSYLSLSQIMQVLTQLSSKEKDLDLLALEDALKKENNPYKVELIENLEDGTITFCDHATLFVSVNGSEFGITLG